MSSLLYSAGKLREYKERKLMNKRVEDLSLGQEHKEKENSVFVDMTETGEYVGEGEFKILGNKIEDYQYSRESIPEEALSDLLEIKSFDEDLNLIGDDDETFELPKLGIRLVEAKREDKAGIPEKHADAVAISSEVIEDEFSVVPISTEQKVTKLKRSPLKFGFKEGE
jgi:hypothetical protein